MKKNWRKRGGALFVAFMLGLTSLPAYAAEPTDNAGAAERPITQYDTTKPVIESVEFVQNGQTLTTEDTLQINVDAYDADSGIALVTAHVNLKRGEGYWHSYEIEFTYNEEKGCYVGEYSLEGVEATAGAISNIRVVDQNNNYAEWKDSDEDGNDLYTFDMIQELPEYTVTDFQLQENGQTLKVGDQVHFSVTLEPADSDPGDVMVSIREEGTTSLYTYTVYLYDDEETGTYTGTLYIDEAFTGTSWKINNVSINGVPVSTEGVENYGFSVEGERDAEAPVITSITVDRNGETLKVGDSVGIHIQAADNLGINTSYAYAYMSPSADILQEHYIELTYNEQTDTFDGVFEVTGDTYPCEWYLSSVYICDMQNNQVRITDYDEDFYLTYPYYVNVTNDDTFAAQTYDVNVVFMAIDADGSWKQVSNVQKKNVARRSTFAEAGIEFPEFSDSYPGITQTGWRTVTGREIDSSTQIIDNMGYTYIYAAYDKMPHRIAYYYLGADGQEKSNVDETTVFFDAGTTYGDVIEYMNQSFAPEETYGGMTFQGWQMGSYYDPEEELGTELYLYAHAVYDKGVFISSFGYLKDTGEWGYASAPVLFEKGATYAEVLPKAEEFRPSDMSKDVSLAGWTSHDYNAANQVVGDYSYGSFTADYGDKCVALAGREYYDEKGYWIAESVPYIVDKGAKVSEIYDKLKAMDMPKMYEGLRFESWNEFNPDSVISESGERYYLEAKYSNCLIRMGILPENLGAAGAEEFEYLYCIVAEKGETITLPSSFEGYENLNWMNYPEGGQLTVQGNLTIWAYADGSAGPDDPEYPSQPGQEEGTMLPDSAVEAVVGAIQNADAGESIRVDMGEATVISKEILEAAKGKDVNIQLDMGGYTWTINGQKIQASALENVNLAVEVNADAIPSQIVQELAGDNPTQQLVLAHEGDFGFQAELTLNVGSEYAGKYGNLYYYDSDGKMVFMNAGEIAPEGSLSLTFSHASAYVIVFSNEQMSGSESDPMAFTDIKEDDWFHEYVQYVYENGLMTGLNDTTFGPNEKLARAQFAVILHRLNGTPAMEYTARFHDVGAGLWYTDAILWAADAGVVTGYTNGNYGPGDNINREQIAVMMYRYANSKGYDTSTKADFSKYQDAAWVSGFAQEAMQWAVGEGIITGKYDQTQLDPQGSATRAECATIMMRFMERYEK